MVNIAVINESTAYSDAAVKALIPALQDQWNEDLAPVWDLEDVEIAFFSKDVSTPNGYWQFVFFDTSDQANALAYHDVTADGLPICKVFVQTIQDDNASVSVAASHELCEAAVDPTINLAAQDLTGTFWAYEVCDPVEDDQYGYDKDGVLVSDFITPAWFGFRDSAAPFDFKDKCSAPFQVLAAGYAQKFDPVTGWQQINGAAVAKSHALTAAKGSRREQRARR